MTSVHVRDRRREDTEEKAMQRQTQSMQLCCHRPRRTWGHGKLEETREDCFLDPSEGTWLCRHLDFGLMTFRATGEYISVVFLAIRFVAI